jgi:hypothetical protein
MKNLFSKAKQFAKTKACKVGVTVSLAFAILAISASAADPPDISTVMTTSIQSIVTNTLACIAAVAPIAITVFGAMFAWKIGVKFFKGVAK